MLNKAKIYKYSKYLQSDASGKFYMSVATLCFIAYIGSIYIDALIFIAYVCVILSVLAYAISGMIVGYFHRPNPFVKKIDKPKWLVYALGIIWLILITVFYLFLFVDHIFK